MKTSQTAIPIIIAIDGPAASGKSTVGQLLAEKLGYIYFDTGVMYRAVTLAVLDQQIDINDETSVTRIAEQIKIEIGKPSKDDGRMYDVFLDGVDVTWKIRQPEVESAVSPISAYPGVRSAMTAQQRKIGIRGKVVMVGRDIGTIVLPEADLKIYLEASVEERAKRRYAESQTRGKLETFDALYSSLKERDRIDSTRKYAPLKPAADAIIINTDKLNQQEVLEKILKWINKETNYESERN